MIRYHCPYFVVHAIKVINKTFIDSSPIVSLSLVATAPTSDCDNPFMLLGRTLPGESSAYAERSIPEVEF